MNVRHLPARFWLLTVAALVGALVAAGLGFWQLSRGAEKRALQLRIDDQKALAALDARALSEASSGHADLLYRLVRLRGNWLNRHTVYLDNRQMNGKPGFFVLTPLQLESSSATVLVQRGWVPRSFTDRVRVPEVATPAGLVDVAGRIAPPPSKLYEFEKSQGGVIRQNLDLEQFSREIGVQLAPVSVLQLDASGDGLVRDWPRVNSGIEKHIGYAFQWFALSGLIVFLYGWFQIVRRFFPSR